MIKFANNNNNKTCKKVAINKQFNATIKYL